MYPDPMFEAATPDFHPQIRWFMLEPRGWVVPIEEHIDEPMRFSDWLSMIVELFLLVKNRNQTVGSPKTVLAKIHSMPLHQVDRDTLSVN